MRKIPEKGGLLLADNGHNDATRAYVSDDYGLLGAFVPSGPEKAYGDIRGAEFVADCSGAFFQTTRNVSLTVKMAEEILTRPPSKMSYRLKRKALLYLF